MIYTATRDTSPYKLLKTKEIIAILDGDTKYGKYEFENGTSVRIAMPYLSGTDICSMANVFGFPMTYSNMSRWQYFDDLMDYCLTKNKFSNLLAYLFEKERFSKILSGRSPIEIKAAYEHIINTVIDKINGILYFGGNELAIVGKKFLVKPIGSKVTVQAAQIKTIDREYNVIEKKGDIPSDSGDMAKLFKQVKDLYNMHANRNVDK